MSLDPEAFVWRIYAPKSVAYIQDDVETIDKAINAFRAQLPHHTLARVSGVVIINADGTLVQRSWDLTRNPKEGEA